MKLLLLILLPAFTFAQRIYEGSVIDRATRLPVPFANIEYFHGIFITTADAQGNFVLPVNKIKNKYFAKDSMIVSCVGYKTEIFPASVTNNTVELEQLPLLPRLTIPDKNNWQYAALNNEINCDTPFYNLIGCQSPMAKSLTAPVPGCIITSVRVSQKIEPSERHETMFRLRFYDMDSVTKAPSADLCGQVVQVKTDKEVIDVNVESYNIHITGTDFFVAVEWLSIPYNQHYFPSPRDGKILPAYRPNICIKNSGHPAPHEAGEEAPVWVFSRSKWEVFSPAENATIGATIKY